METPSPPWLRERVPNIKAYGFFNTLCKANNVGKKKNADLQFREKVQTNTGNVHFIDIILSIFIFYVLHLLRKPTMKCSKQKWIEKAHFGNSKQSRLIFNCSKSTIKHQKKRWNMFKLLVFLLLTLNIFHNFL